MRILAVLLMCAFICCDEETMVSEKDKFFRGNHLLESMEIGSETNIYTPRSDKTIYLTIHGATNISNFMFKGNNGSYINASLPYNRMQLQFIPEESTEHPYCKFRWSTSCCFKQFEWQDEVVYYVIAIKKSQIQNL